MLDESESIQKTKYTGKTPAYGVRVYIYLPSLEIIIERAVPLGGMDAEKINCNSIQG